MLRMITKEQSDGLAFAQVDKPRWRSENRNYGLWFRCQLRDRKPAHRQIADWITLIVVTEAWRRLSRVQQATRSRMPKPMLGRTPQFRSSLAISDDLNLVGHLGKCRFE